jgi:ferredoxin
MKNRVRKWLEDGTVDLFIGNKMIEGHPLPHFFSRDNIEEVNELIIGSARYPLEKVAMEIMAKKPDIKIGLFLRDCNQRALNVLCIWNQLEPDNLKTIRVTCCPSELNEHGDCSYLEPKKSGSYKKRVGIDNNMAIEELEAFGQNDRLDRWLYEFQKCIKCYGCRNICPVCFCKECILEHPDLIGTGNSPPEIPIFHLVRAVHMAGRCIDCGLCEEACPADIPLRLLYKKVNRIVKDLFDYESGTSSDQPPFSLLGDKVTLEPEPLQEIQMTV